MAPQRPVFEMEEVISLLHSSVPYGHELSSHWIYHLKNINCMILENLGNSCFLNSVVV
jgi:ubiquitin C-terminal hydrolase